MWGTCKKHGQVCPGPVNSMLEGPKPLRMLDDHLKKNKKIGHIRIWYILGAPESGASTPNVMSWAILNEGEGSNDGKALESARES